ncbi:polysaccharide biosynthesis protein [Desulfolithobacter dissulfuricans]|uniref:Polysaccharide biosynthesis protein n=1 Tax=Desulfolithobacter dissulfuricans TaxID=2795293 RepID=A0A915TXQ7_9BACT|nr:oligosaccharide flippase family protein [Desulfolithobacter dissulfuricans]BCO07681.1 polysaccharide biosynthesis protein [Desulfolithobacter dissulfuricans]
MDIKQLIKNIFSNWGIYALSMIVSIFLTPFIIGSLGKGYYGIWVLINSLVGYMNILDFGVRPAVNRYVAKYIGLDDNDGIRRVISSSSIILLGVACIVVVITFIFAHFLPLIFNIHELDFHAIKLSLIVVGLGFAISLPLQISGAVLGAYERYDIQNLNKFLMLIARTLLIVYFLKNNKGILCLSLIVSITGIVQYLLDYISVSTIFHKVTISLGYFDPDLLKKILSFGFFSFIIQVSLQITYYIDVTVVGVFLSTSAVAVYSISASLVEYSRQLVGNMTRVFTPSLTKLFYKKRVDKISEYYVVATHYTSAISFPLVAGLAILGDEFILLWVGDGFSSSYSIMLILLIPQIVGLSQQMSAQVMFGFGRNDVLAYLEMVSAFFNLCLSIVLVKLLGMIGVALATAVPLLITHTFLLPYIVCRRLDLSISKYIKDGYFKSILNTSIMALYILCVKSIWPSDSWIVFLSTVTTAVLLYGSTGWFILLDVRTREKILRYVNGLSQYNV